MATKAQLLAQLALLDVGTLEKLVRLSETIFTPEEDQLVNVTFSQMVDKAHLLADIHFPQWTDRSKADFGEFLVELFALFSEKDFWYINAFANEGFIQKSTIYSNTYYHALRLGYSANLLKSATGKCKLTFAPGNEIYINPGEIVVAIPNTTLEYSNSKPIHVPYSVVSLQLTVDFAQGIYQTETTNFTGKSVRLAAKSVDGTVIVQTINNLTWTQVVSFSQSNISDKVFMFLPENDGSGQLIYGTGGYGLRPTVGDTIDTLFRTNVVGTDGNKAVGLITQVKKSPPSRLVTLVQQVTQMTGGQNQEPIEDVRNNAINLFRTQGKIINGSDCEITLNAFADVYQSKAVNYANNLYFYVVLASGIPATTSDMEDLKSRIEDIVIMGYGVQGLLTSFVVISFDVDVYTLPGYNPLDVQNAVFEVVEAYTDPNGLATYGQDFDISEVAQELISNVAGVQNVVWNLVNGGAPANVVVPATSIMEKLVLTNATINVIQ